MKPINQERDMRIYHARKDDKRTFADIGREYGISLNRARAVYRRLDWQLNGMDADHHRNKPDSLLPWLEAGKDPATGLTVVTTKSKA